ncbi:MAG: divalent-cation tolerance protein CutA [Mariprofundaceae bacterium]
MREIVLITTTVDDETAARRIARTLIEERLAACVRIGAPEASHYRWRGRIEEAREFALHIKTAPAARAAAIERLKSLHPYELPEILCLPCAADEGYAAWVEAETAPGQDEPDV